MKKYLDLSLTICLVLFYPLSTVVLGQNHDMVSATTCLNNINMLEKDINLMEATTEMLDSYNRTCTNTGSCSSEVITSVATTTNDFTFLVTGNSLERMESACNNILPGSTLCLVTNEIMKGGLKTIEINKPVCFPPSCDENNNNEIRFLDPNPGNCDPSSIREPCTVSSTVVSCPKLRTENLDAATCQSEAATILSNNALNRFVSALRNSVVRGCLSVLLGSTSPVCEITTPLHVIASQNYSGFDSSINEEYEIFERNCINSESDTAICRISAQIYANEAQSFIEMETDLTYTDLPLCLPLDCTRIDPLITVQEQMVKENFDCDAVNSFCEVNVTKFECEINEPQIIAVSSFPSIVASTSPTITTSPSESPSSVNSTSPSSAGSSFPSIVASTSPSESPSSVNSTSPSSAGSSFPSIATSTSPSIITLPSESPSSTSSTSPSSVGSIPPSRLISTLPSHADFIAPSTADSAFPSITGTPPTSNRSIISSKSSNSALTPLNDVASGGESVGLGRMNGVYFSFVILLLSSWHIF